MLTFSQSTVKLPYIKILTDGKITEGMCPLSVLIFLLEKESMRAMKMCSLTFAKNIT